MQPFTELSSMHCPKDNLGIIGDLLQAILAVSKPGKSPTELNLILC